MPRTRLEYTSRNLVQHSFSSGSDLYTMSSLSRNPRGLPANPRLRAESAARPPVPPHDPISLPANPRVRRPSIRREQVLDTDWNPSQKTRRGNELYGTRSARSLGNSSPISSSRSSSRSRGNYSHASSRTTLQSDDGIQHRETGSGADANLPTRHSTDNEYLNHFVIHRLNI